MELFEKALNNEGWMSRLGADIQMWLALAYQARGSAFAQCCMLLEHAAEGAALRAHLNSMTSMLHRGACMR